MSQYLSSTANFLGNSEVSVTSTGGLASALNANAGTGRWLVLDGGKTYNIDLSTLGATLQNVGIRGVPGSAAGTGFASVINVTGTGAANDSTIWTDYAIRDLVITGPTVNPDRAFIRSTSSTGGDWANVTFIDFAGRTVLGHGPFLKMRGMKWLQSGSPPATMGGAVNAPAGPFWLDNFVIDYQNAQGHGALVGTAGPLAANVFGPYWVTNGSFLPSNVFSSDVAVDLEFGGATSLNKAYLGNLDVWNAKAAYAVNVDYLEAVGIRHRTTSVYNNAGQGITGGNPVLSTAGTAGTAKLGTVILKNVLATQDANSVNAGTRLINLSSGAGGNAYVHRFVCENFEGIVNGALGAPSNNPAIMTLGSTANGANAYDEIDLNNITFGYTSVPGTPLPGVFIGSSGASSTAEFVKVRNLKYLGVTVGTDDIPATVAGGVSSVAIGFGTVGNTFSPGSVLLDGIDTSQVTLTVPTASAPAMFGTQGTFTPGSFSYGPTNSAVLGRRVLATGAAVGTLVTYTPPADATFQVSGYVNVTASTTHSFNFDITWTDENNTTHTNIPLLFANVPAGTDTTTFTNALGVTYYAARGPTISAKAGTAVLLKTAGTFTTVTYDVGGWLRQVA